MIQLVWGLLERIQPGPIRSVYSQPPSLLAAATGSERGKENKAIVTNDTASLGTFQRGIQRSPIRSAYSQPPSLLAAAAGLDREIQKEKETRDIVSNNTASLGTFQRRIQRGPIRSVYSQPPSLLAVAAGSGRQKRERKEILSNSKILGSLARDSARSYTVSLLLASFLTSSSRYTERKRQLEYEESLILEKQKKLDY